MKVVDRNFKSFFALIKLAQKGEYKYSQIKLPHYLEKDGFFNLIFPSFNINNGVFSVPMSIDFRQTYGKVNIDIPSNLKNKRIKEIRIIPKNTATSFEIQYIYEIDSSELILDKDKAIAIDFGIDNLATCVTNSGDAFIVDGKRLKSVNAYTNKTNARLQSVKDKQGIKGQTKKQNKLWSNRNNRINDYLNKSAKIIVDYCMENDIGTLILGYNKDIQKESNIGRVNNQNFVNIPIGQLRHKLEYLCQRNNIVFVEQEESYTSKADFLANDPIPKYGENKGMRPTFSGKRVERGLYRSSTGIILNADCNGALNIMRKSNLVEIELTNKGYISPVRVMVD